MRCPTRVNTGIPSLLDFAAHMLNPIMFADGTCFLSSHSNITDLFEIASKENKNVFEWCSMNDLSQNSPNSLALCYSVSPGFALSNPP